MNNVQNEARENRQTYNDAIAFKAGILYAIDLFLDALARGEEVRYIENEANGLRERINKSFGSMV